MALTVSLKYRWNIFHTGAAVAIIAVTGDSSYPSGGYTISPSLFTFNAFADTSDFQLQTAPTFGPVGVWADGSHSAAGDYAQIDSTTGNMRLFGSGGTELTAGASATTIVTGLIAFGR